jgi:DNA-directed RNA polymerase
MIRQLECGNYPRGGFLHCSTSFVRTRSQAHKERIARADECALLPCFDALNTLSATPWVINERVLNYVEFMWEVRHCAL